MNGLDLCFCIKFIKLSLPGSMKKALTIRTISFKEQHNKRKLNSASPNRCRVFQRSETLTAQRQSKPTKGVAEKHQTKRTSLKNSQKSSKNQNCILKSDKTETKMFFNKEKSRYNQKTNAQQEIGNKSSLSSHHFHKLASFSEPAKQLIIENNNTSQSIQTNKTRIKSQSNQSKDLKKQLMKRVSKKIDFMRKMTIEDDIQTIQPIHFSKPIPKDQDSAKMFNFDKLYDYCLRKINREISRYERRTDGFKDKKYYQLKLQSNVLNKSLVEVRKSMVHWVEGGQNQRNMGIVGNLIDMSKSNEKSSSKLGRRKLNTACCEKRRPNSKTGQSCNPFSLETRGWQIREKQEYFQLCE